MASSAPYIDSIDEVFDVRETQKYDLTIQLALDGFSFTFREADKNRIIAFMVYRFERNMNHEELFTALNDTLIQKGLKNAAFRSVRCLIEDRNNTLVPEELYSDKKAETYLGFNHQLLTGATMKADYIKEASCKNVYQVAEIWMNDLMNNWESATVMHQSTVFINDCLKEADKDLAEIFIDVRNHCYDMAIVNKGSLCFFNNFLFNTKEDFAYFLLFAMNQQKLSGADITLHFSGMILPQSEIASLCSRYVKDIAFVQCDQTIQICKALRDTPFQYYYIPYRSFQCES